MANSALLLGARSRAEAVHQLFWIPVSFAVVQEAFLHQIFDRLVDGGQHLRQKHTVKNTELTPPMSFGVLWLASHLHAVVGGELRQEVLLCNLKEITVEGPLAKSAGGSGATHGRRARTHGGAPALNIREGRSPLFMTHESGLGGVFKTDADRATPWV